MQSTFVAAGKSTVKDRSVTIPLKAADETGSPTDAEWTGSGSYIPALIIAGDVFMHTESNYAITRPESVIAFTKFKSVN